MKEEPHFKKEKNQIMKRIALLVGLTLVIFASCKKDYTCECTRTDSSKTFPTDSYTETMNGKKKDVVEHCEEGDTTYGTITIVCEAK